MTELTDEERMEKMFQDTRMRIQMAHANAIRGLRDDGRKAKRNLILQLVATWVTVIILIGWIFS